MENTTILSMNDFFHHGSRWVRADFHLHTASADEFNKKGISAATYCSDFIDRLKQENIRLAAITNHNKFDKPEFLQLKTEAEKYAIRLLAGIEFSAKDGQRGTHILIVFNDDWYETEDHINNFIKRAFHLKYNYDKMPYDVNSDYDLCESVRELDKYEKDYFIVMAHIDHKNGFLEEVRGRNLEALVTSEAFKNRVLGFQKSTSIEKRKNCEQLMSRRIALIEGSDNAAQGIAGVGLCNGKTRKCYLKLGAYSFEAVKFALFHHTERVQAELPAMGRKYLREVNIVRGDRTDTIPLNSELNTLIGVRGSGKSSLLETIRYALGLSVLDSESNGRNNGNHKDFYKNEVVRRFVGEGSEVELVLAAEQGKVCNTIRRRWGGQPQVFDATGALQPGLLPEKLLSVAYFGQKDIEEMGKDFNSKYIEEKLLKEKLAPIRNEEESKIREIRNIFQQMSKFTDYQREKEQTERRLAELRIEIQEFEQSGLEGLVQRELNFGTDKTKLEQIEHELVEEVAQLKETVTSYGWETYLTYEPKEAESRQFFEERVKPLIGEVIQATAYLKSWWIGDETTQPPFLAKMQSIKIAYEELHNSFEEEFRTAKQKISDPNINVEKHKANKRELQLKEDELRLLNEKLQNQQNIKRQLEAQLKALESIREEAFAVVTAQMDQLNQLGLSFHVNVHFRGDKEAYKQWLFDKTKNLQRDNHINKITNRYPNPIAIYDDLEAADSELAKILSGGNLLSNFREQFHKELAEMLTYRVPDKYEFLYNGKDLQKYSYGQKSTALISFVLANTDKNLFLIDQPEDDLDNYTVAKEIISRIAILKPTTQFIFVTHNPNLLVLGDSEQVIVCEYHADEERIHFPLIGSIDSSEVQQKALQIMEGGKEAFDRRKNVYQTWKH